jgi:phosphoglycerate dehydrogenase-like enzyme
MAFRVAVLDDWQAVARRSADWSALERRAQVEFFEQPLEGPDELVRALAGFDAILAMRERTAFPASLIEQLAGLKLIALTGVRSGTLDLDACTARGILVCNTGSRDSTATTAELTLALLLAAARHVPAADRGMRAGGFQRGVPLGTVLEGKTLGVVGLGKIGTRMARYGNALGMRVLAWSPNMTPERAEAAGAQAVDKVALFAESHAVTLHLVLSSLTRSVVGGAELDRMPPGAILVNTARGPLVDEAALIERLRAGRLTAGLDVFDREPLPRDHPLRTLPNVVLSPHLGYCTAEIYQQFYRESIENLLAFLDGKPIRVMNPQV